MKRLSRLAALLAAVLLLSALSCAFAADPIDTDRLGSLRLTMRYEGEPVTGGDLILYRVADVDGAAFRLVPALADSGADLSDPADPQLAPQLAAAVERAGLSGMRTVLDAQGEARFADLPVGLYLLTQQTASPGFERIAPVLVSVPMLADGVYVYDVDASPKPSVEKTPASPTPAPGPNLPQTGQLNWPVPVMAAAGLLCLLAGALLLRPRRKEPKP